jgi:cobalt-zinc-cadmium resistance protein CzcA
MVISSSAAEVQRPLATVVIGGLFTATILTMVVLPIFINILMEKNSKPNLKHRSTTYVILLMLSTSFLSQNTNTELDSLIVVLEIIIKV